MKLLSGVFSSHSVRHILSRHVIYANIKFDTLHLHCQPFSLSSDKQLLLYQKDDMPIKLSSSPIKNYKTTKTFKDDNNETRKYGLKPPIIVGSIFLLGLVVVMVFGSEEPLDLFSTETLGKFEERINSTVQLAKSDTGNDRK